MTAITVLPESARLRSVSTTPVAAVLSKPLVGSSRKITLGLEMSSQAIASRRRSPPDIPRTFASPTIVSAAFSSLIWERRSFTSASRAFFPILLPSLNSTRKFSVSRTVVCGKKVTSCSTKAQGIIEPPDIGSPLTYRDPCNDIFEFSFTRPASACRTVDLPAPLGPMIASIRPGLARPRMLPSSNTFSFFFPFRTIRISLKERSTDSRPPIAPTWPSLITMSSSTM
mmetsp:Transcript_111001/g.320787  ORF Transcript_111001/g.320787 Transcript_111001/m.320787 type:complete len:227 (-) Transcript_111001:194-874(-)